MQSLHSKKEGRDWTALSIAAIIQTVHEAFEIIAEKYDENKWSWSVFFLFPLPSLTHFLCGKALSPGAGSTEDMRVTAKRHRPEVAILHLSRWGGGALANISS